MTFTAFTEATSPFPAALRPRLADLADKVVLGSDFPNIPHAYAHQIEVLADLGLGDDWLRSVLFENGRRLLGY
jgi:predicted TIM-barrel fold metal-dependent hydrolase